MREGKGILSGGVNRRTFLKATGALGAALAIEASPKDLLRLAEGAASAAPAEVKIIPTWCHGCAASATNCAVLCQVQDGKLVRIEGNPEAGNNWGLGCTSLCAKAHTAMQYEYSPDRLTYPMKRVGEKGEGKFQRISWDEALDTIAAKLKEAKEKYGPETFCYLVSEFSPVRDTLGRRFLNVYGSPNYSWSALCGPRFVAATATIGFSSEAPDDWNNCRLIVNWGSNCENSKVNRSEAIGLIEALEKGVQMIDIRPMLDPMASKADTWLPIRPGTDCALALAILNVIIGEKRYDAQFVSDWCYGFDKLAEHVKQYPPQWAAPITGLAADQITQLARQMATTKPMCIKTGNGIGDQQNDGSSAMSAICLIEAITGNLDVPGGNYAGTNLPNLIPTRNLRVETLLEKAPPDFYDKLLAPGSPRWLQKLTNIFSPAAYYMPNSAGYKVLQCVLTGKPYTPRVLGVMETSVLSQQRNPERNAAAALKKVDFTFVMDLYWSPVVDYADIVLPASSLYEQSHNFGTKNRPDGTWIGMRNKVVEPLFDTRSDFQFWLDLAVKMGYGKDFWNGDMDACLRYQLEPSGIKLEDLRNSPRGVLVKRTPPAPAPQYKRYAQLFRLLPHGKVQCYNELIGGKPNCDETGTLPYFPTYQGPPEGIAQTPELVKDYPLIFSDVHAYRLTQHSSYPNLPYLRELQPYPWVKINPATAKKYGINDGDWMKIESPHGWVKMVAEYFEGIAPEVLMTRRGWWQGCPELNLPGYSVLNGGAEPNVLYSGDARLADPLACQMAKQTLVRISKA